MSLADEELDEPFHGDDCFRRSVEDHEVEMGRAMYVTPSTAERDLWLDIGKAEAGLQPDS